MTYHTSVLLEQSVDLLNITDGSVYVDATFGGGGHSCEILLRLKQEGKLIAIDQDEDALENGIEDKRFHLIRGNFRFIKNHLRFINVLPVDGILADLGLSSHQIDEMGRGFSFSKNASLDMRMNQFAKRSAKELINEAEKSELIKIFRTYGDIKNAPKLAHSIDLARLNKQIQTTYDLAEIAKKLAPAGKENKYLAKVFQAIRIEVNDEVGALKEFLARSYECLKVGGRLVVISYHSLEDRLVKEFFREEAHTEVFDQHIMGHKNTKWNPLMRKVIMPKEEEILKNPRSRSAKLRAAVKANLETK